MTVYLDYAATSAVRPPEVIEAVTRFLRDVGATPGRGGYAPAVEAARVALRCRMRLAELLGIPGDPGRIAFMLNATHALNTALNGLLEPGDVCVRTMLDHNAVRRPLHALARRGVEERVLAASVAGDVDEDEARERLRGAKLLVLNGASNVLGCRPPLERLTALAHEAGALVLLDSAQLAGDAPLDVAALGVDLVAITGHKALLGPQGLGALWLREGVDVAPLLRGGTGGDSRNPGMPAAYPDRLEAGTQNAPAMAGLAAGCEWLLEHGVAELHERLRDLARRLHQVLGEVPGVRVRSPEPTDGAPIVTITAEGATPSTLARRLDERGVCARAGLHCAPDAHELAGTLPEGAVRFSFGWASAAEDVAAAVEAVEQALAAPVHENTSG